MTKAEAAQELQRCVDLIKQDGKDWLGERDIPILEMAIDALSAEEIIHCKDCASVSYDSLFNQYWCNGHMVSMDFYCAKGGEEDKWFHEGGTVEFTLKTVEVIDVNAEEIEE